MAFNNKGIGPLFVPIRTGTTLYSGYASTDPIVLSNDLYAGDVTLVSRNIRTNGFRIFCNNLYLKNSYITTNGSDGGNVTGGTGSPLGSLAGGGAGGAGGHDTTPNGTAGGGVNLCSIGDGGGSGGNGVTGSGGSGGTTSFNTIISNFEFGESKTSDLPPTTPSFLQQGVFIGTLNTGVSKGICTAVAAHGGSGGGGGGDSTDSSHAGAVGGGGGGGGGVLFIACSGNLILDGVSGLQANGGDGGDGSTSNGYTGGGGGGGGGGGIVVTCNQMHLYDTSYLQALGGSGGTGGNNGSDGDNGLIFISTPNGTYIIQSGEILGDDFPEFPYPYDGSLQV